MVKLARWEGRALGKEEENKIEKVELSENALGQKGDFLT
jgi:hypothetical protein